MIAKRWVGVFFLIPLVLHLRAQQGIIPTATQYITTGKFGAAEYYLDSILKKNPKNVDALVMKGNVLLNYTWQNTSKNYFDLDRAESVLDTSGTIDQSFFAPIIPEDTSRLVEHFWLKALFIDSNRSDIQKGLCNLYSLAMRTADLKARLLKMKKAITANPDNAFVYAEYARNIKAHGKFDEGMEIYQWIANMFPSLAGIRCDMAGEYFYAGLPRRALEYLDTTFSEKTVDQTSFVNGAALYSMMGLYEDAQAVLERYSLEDSVLAGDFYKGLLQFARMDTTSYWQLKSFIQKATEQNYYDEVHLTQRIWPFLKTGFNMDDYRVLVKDAAIPDYYKILIHERAIRQDRNNCEPKMNLGILACTNKNYRMAMGVLDNAENCGADKNQRDKWVLAEAYSLYRNGDTVQAMAKFNITAASENLFAHQASQYFLAKILAGYGKKEKASQLCSLLIDEKVGTKYQYLARHFQATLK